MNTQETNERISVYFQFKFVNLFAFKSATWERPQNMFL